MRQAPDGTIWTTERSEGLWPLGAALMTLARTVSCIRFPSVDMMPPAAHAADRHTLFAPLTKAVAPAARAADRGVKPTGANAVSMPAALRLIDARWFLRSMGLGYLPR